MAGILDNLMGNLQNPNPLMMMGLATMAASAKPGATTASALGEGAMSGLMSYQMMQREAMRMQMLQQQQAMQEQMFGLKQQELAMRMQEAGGPNTTLQKDFLAIHPGMADKIGTPEYGEALYRYQVDKANMNRPAPPQITIPPERKWVTTEQLKYYKNAKGETPKGPMPLDQILTSGYEYVEPITEAQRRADAFYSRMQGRSAQIDEILSENPEFNPGSARQAAARNLGQQLATETGQKFLAIRDAWLMDALRLESGAVIGDKEKQSFGETYFPIVNEPAEVQALKRQLREDFERSVAAQGSQKSQEEIMEFADNRRRRDRATIEAFKLEQGMSAPPTASGDYQDVEIGTLPNELKQELDELGLIY